MKKAILKKYIFIVILTTIILSIAFFYFNVLDNILYKQNELQNISNILKNIDNDLQNISSNIEDINIYISSEDGEILTKNINYNALISKYALIDLIQNFLANTEQNFYYKNNKLFFIDYFNKEDTFLIINTNIYFIKDLLINIAYAVFISLFLLSFIIYFMTKNFKRDFISPILNISEEILKIEKNMEKPIFKETKFEEIDIMQKATDNINKKIKSMFYDIKIQNNKLKYILDNINEGFLLFDKNRKVFIINKMAKKILNAEDKKAGENIIYYTQNIKIINSIENVLSKKENSVFDIKTEDNKIYSLYVSKLEEGIFENNYGGIIFFLDITLEREAQMLKQQFFSDISHELKTPITSIKGYAELLYNNFAKNIDMEKEFLKRIQKETDNITNLINNILTISKLENNYKDEHNKTKIRISSLVNEIIETITPLCIKNNITIYNKCDDIEIFADYNLMHKLFSNLIINAIKYNKKNGYVNILCFNKNNFINIIVEDNGIGINILDRNRIFERFYIASKNRVKNLNGSGLGLSIVKHIVNFYNGTIELETEENIGTKFLIKINSKYLN